MIQELFWVNEIIHPFYQNFWNLDPKSNENVDIKEILQHEPLWPAEDQEELAEVAREIEARRAGVYVLDKDEEAAIREGIEQLDRGEAVTEEKMRSFWKRCGVL